MMLINVVVGFCRMHFSVDSSVKNKEPCSHQTSVFYNSPRVPLGYNSYFFRGREAAKSARVEVFPVPRKRKENDWAFKISSCLFYFYVLIIFWIKERAKDAKNQGTLVSDHLWISWNSTSYIVGWFWWRSKVGSVSWKKDGRP